MSLRRPTRAMQLGFGFDEEPAGEPTPAVSEAPRAASLGLQATALPSGPGLEGEAESPRMAGGGVTLADIVEQIRRDLEALTDPWLTDEFWRNFFQERIASYRAWAKEMTGRD